MIRSTLWAIGFTSLTLAGCSSTAGAPSATLPVEAGSDATVTAVDGAGTVPSEDAATANSRERDAASERDGTSSVGRLGDASRDTAAGEASDDPPDGAAFDSRSSVTPAPATGCRSVSVVADGVDQAHDVVSCSRNAQGSIVRLKVCAAPASDGATDVATAYCVNVDIAADALMNADAGAELVLDGNTTLPNENPGGTGVRPSEVVYTASAPQVAIARVWMEKRCLCAMTNPEKTQAFVGRLTIEAANPAHLSGTISITGVGMIPPSAGSETVTMTASFDIGQ